MKFIVDDAPYLDTGCTFRSGGPLTFEIEITRYVGPVDAEGHLVDPAGLVAAGVLSAKARLVMPAFDVDYDAVPGPPYDPERDRVLFNDEEIGFLNGINGTWILNGFDIPIEKLKFPALGSAGGDPVPAVNRIRIDIDTANEDVGEELWCTSIDWAALSFKTVSPIVLVHGNNSNGGFFDRRGFSARLATARLTYDGCGACPSPINLGTNTIRANGTTLGQTIPGIVRRYGADSYHLVVHSKGGLDTRQFLANLPASHDGLRALSFTSLSTPHNGSVGADLLVDRYGVVTETGRDPEFSGFPGWTPLISSLVPLDVATDFVAGFNASNVGRLPSGLVLHTVGADADVNGNGQMDRSPDEYAELRAESADLQAVDDEFGGHTKSRTFVNVCYLILRRTADIQVTYETRRTLFGGTKTVGKLTSVPTTTPLGNDVLVTIPSARGDGSIAGRVTQHASFTGAQGRNHSNVADGGVAGTVIPWILQVERTRGDLK